MNDAGVRQLAKTRWSVRVKRIDARTGRVRNRKVLVLGTKREALEARDRLRAELAGRGPKVRQTLATFARAWLALRVLLKQSTRDKYTTALEQHILPELGELFVDALVPSDVRAYIARRAAAAAGNTALNELRLLRVIARDSVAEGLATMNWCERVKAPPVAHYTDEQPNLLTPAQVELVLKHVRPRWHGLMKFVLTTGLRIGEATALDWSDVDVDAGVARIHRGNYRGVETSVKTKGSNRIVPVLPEVLALWGLRRSSGLVFPSRHGTRHKGSPLRYQLERACELAGIAYDVTQHGLRRTFNNDARQVEKGEVVRAMTGHTTEEMTEHYSHVSAAEKTSLSRRVGERMGVLSVSERRTDNEAKP